MAPSDVHRGVGIGMVINNLPVAISKMKLPLSYFFWEKQFTDPTHFFHSGIEIGVHGIYALSPVPEVGANLYLGSEEGDIQGKLGLGAVYDIIIGGHAGLTAKAGIIYKNRFDFSFILVPTGTDAKQSYYDVFGVGEGSNEVDMPYGGFMFTIRY